MLQLKSEGDYVLSFTPQSNEFTITVPSSANAGHTAGLCGNTFMQNIPDLLRFPARCLRPPTHPPTQHLLSPIISHSGACGADKLNVLSLRNGSTTTDQPGFVSDWADGKDGSVCTSTQRAVCAAGAAMGCQALRSEVFQPCHAHIPVQVLVAKCEEQACEQSDVCELISAYARLCRERGACIDWRSPHLCRKSVF